MALKYRTQKIHNAGVREKAKEMEENEWDELMGILKADLRNFWA